MMTSYIAPLSPMRGETMSKPVALLELPLLLLLLSDSSLRGTRSTDSFLEDDFFI